MGCVFLAALSPKLNIIYCFSTEQYFEVANHSSPLAPLQREIDIDTREPFWMEFNFEKLLFEAFFDAMRIFGSV